MSSSDEDEIDRRFRELIRAEFGDVAGARAPGEAAPPPPPPNPPASRRFSVRKLKDPIEYFNLSEALEHATPDDDHERWRPPVDLTWDRPRLRVLIGVALVTVTLLMGMLVLIGMNPGVWAGIVTAAGGAVGLGLLFSALPRRRDDSGDGAQL